MKVSRSKKKTKVPDNLSTAMKLRKVLGKDVPDWHLIGLGIQMDICYWILKDKGRAARKIEKATKEISC